MWKSLLIVVPAGIIFLANCGNHCGKSGFSVEITPGAVNFLISTTEVWE